MPGTLRLARLLHGVVLSSWLAAVAPAGNLTTGCVDRFDPGADYFPEKAVMGHAAGFAVEYHRSYKVVTVGKAYPDGPRERYVLLQCGAPRPALAGDLASAPVITVPVKALFSASTTHLPLLQDLGRLEVLAGVRTVADVISPPVTARIQAGRVTEFGSHAAIDAELIVLKRPDLLMTGGDHNAAYTTLRGAGVPVVANVEWLEPTPLGRAEWVKYMGLFLNEERRAAGLFEAVRQRYRALVQRVRSIPETGRPRVMTGGGPHGYFYIAGGRSYVATLIADAGGRYVWADNTATASVPVDLEVQLRRAADADVWINGGKWTTPASVLADEPRYAEFKPYRTGQIWVYERRVNAAGANEYFSRSVTRPDLVLADLIKIFHPRLMPDHELEWYIRVSDDR
jgi:iron complex transport system substrate-binding protein